ncbi:hypothetical protein ACFL1N_15680 [Thermodesulfobacteriota bacterium]
MHKSEYDKFAVKKPPGEAFPGVKGRQSPTMTLMSSELVPDCPYYIEVGWITDVPEPHIFEHAIDYDRIILLWGGDYKKPQDLGGTVELYIGGQKIIPLTTTTGIFVPGGTVIGPVTWKEFRHPHIMMNFILGSGDPKVWAKNSDVTRPNDELPKKKEDDDFDYEQYVIRSPMRQAGMPDHDAHRQQPTMTYMSRDQITAANHYIEFGWCWDIVKPDLPRMVHNKYDEIVLHVGSDPDNPEDLGATIDFGMGDGYVRSNTTFGMWVPKELKHGPLVWREYRKPHIEMAIMLGAGTVKEGWEDSFFGKDDADNPPLPAFPED